MNIKQNNTQENLVGNFNIINKLDTLGGYLTEHRQVAGTDFRKWLKGIPYEVAFWQSYYGNKKRRKELFGWSLFNKQCELDEFDIDTFIQNCKSSSPRLLDVGCALSYAFGNIINGEEANVCYVDPLAPFYNKILNRYKIERPYITFGMIESLSASFDMNSIDFIHVRNALDHCSNPLQGIIQCLICLKPEGVLYLNHFIDEAENEGYRGFHQFNINTEDGQLILWNNNTHINVTELCKPFAKVETSITNSGRVVSVITKTCELPSELNNPEQNAKNMTDLMISSVEYFNSFGNSFTYQLSRLISTLGHRTMRVLPWSLLKAIKRLAGK